MRLVMGEVTRMVVVGLALGAAVALLSTRWVKSILFGVSASDPTTVIASMIIMGLVALAAGAMPAWRAARVDPISALREE
jgi:ABC-type antimicrobial peptide transport system permease subunit